MVKIETSQKIIDCANKLFAEHGYVGTIMDDLAEQCSVNKASIYYHHKDKATLYENALTALFTPIADAVLDAVEAANTPVEKLEHHIKTFAKISAENPYFPAILMREMASGGKNMPIRARKQMQRILFTLNSILQTGESQKIFKPADPLIIHFMIIGTINLYITTIPLRQLLPTDDECNQAHNTDIEPASKQLYKTIVDSLLIK
jgi:AcrR family transcriptional regulator